jgi:dihydrofolate reductase
MSDELAEIVAIAAVARNGVIGAGNDIPWRIPADWARFKRLTMGSTLVMGRRTFESIGRPLPGRRTVVVTRDQRWAYPEVETAAGIDEALELAHAHGVGTIFVAGGGEIYRAAWSRLSRLEITEVDATPAGDVVFPAIDPAAWQERSREVHPGFAFVSYVRSSDKVW